MVTSLHQQMKHIVINDGHLHTTFFCYNNKQTKKKFL